MVQGATDGSLRQVRIDSWKSIAQYLGRSSRTVQRWHRDYGVPVRRLGLDGGSVFAYADELDSWLRNRGGTPNGTLVEIPRPALQGGSHSFDRRIFASPAIPGSRKERSAALIAFAYKLWTNLSYANLKLIAKCFSEAIDLDPGNADAFAGLSHALIAQGLMSNLRIPDVYIAAKAALEQAVEINAELPEAKCAAAWLKMVLDRDWRCARQTFDESLNQRVPSTRALVGRALLHIAEGCPREAFVLLRKVVRQNALNALATALYCWSAYLAGDYWDALNLVEEARACGQSGPVLDAVEALASIHCEKPDAYIPRIETLAVDSPNHALLRSVLGYAIALNGQSQRANEILDAITHPAPGKKTATPYAIALVLTGLNEKHDAVQWLEQSYRSGSLWSLGFPSDPLLKPLRDEPSYRTFLSKARYPAPSLQSQMWENSSAILMDGLQASGA
jgi:tetratricopeptide (TPR) repeat protein